MSSDGSVAGGGSGQALWGCSVELVRLVLLLVGGALSLASLVAALAFGRVVPAVAAVLVTLALIPVTVMTRSTQKLNARVAWMSIYFLLWIVYFGSFAVGGR
jgi:hypothetical protein